MKRKPLYIGLVIVLMLTTLLLPVTASAKGWSSSNNSRLKRINIVMTVTGIEETALSTAAWPTAVPDNANAWPIYDVVDGTPAISGWLVDSRWITGTISGDVQGSGVFTYGGILDTMQSGSIQGTLVVQTGAFDTVYMAATGNLVSSVTDYYHYEEIAAWALTQPQYPEGYKIGTFFAQVYNTEMLGMIPDGDLPFELIQLWCDTAGISVGEFFAAVYGEPSLAGYTVEELAAMYGTILPFITGIQLLGGMYGDTLPLLPKTMSAEMSGTLRIDAGTGQYSGASGNGRFQPNNNSSLTLAVTPDQHVLSVEGSVIITGTYKNKTVTPQKPDWSNIKDKLDEWKDKFGNEFPGWGNWNKD